MMIGVIPLLDNEDYEIARIEINNVLFLLREGFYDSPLTMLKNVTFRDYGKGLIGRLAMLEFYSGLGDLGKEEIKSARKFINQRKDLVRIMVKSYLGKSSSDFLV